MESIINEASNGEKMKLGSLCFQTEIYPLGGSQSNWNFQSPRSSGHLLEWTLLECSGQRERQKDPKSI